MKLFDVVALTENLPEACLQIGQVGTIVEIKADPHIILNMYHLF